MALSNDESEWLSGLLEQTEDAGLKGFQETFMDDQRKRYKEYGADIRLSPKQWNVLFGVATDVGYELPPGKSYEPPAWQR